jgi:integrase
LSPLKKLKQFNEMVDRRRSRRILTDSELLQLLAATEAAPKRCNCHIKPVDRSALYRVAAYTGFRASELATLTPEHFHLDAETPHVKIEAQDAKGRREDKIPLADHLMSFLRSWLSGKKPGERLWPGKWAEHRRQVHWLKRDCRRAGLGDGVTFHGLKRKFVTSLIRTGGDIDQVRRLARHKKVQTTLDYYAESNLPDLASLVNRVKPPENPESKG